MMISLWFTAVWSISLFSFWPHPTVCGALVPQPGMEPESWQWKFWVQTTGQPGNSQSSLFPGLLKLAKFPLVCTSSDSANHIYSLSLGFITFQVGIMDCLETLLSFKSRIKIRESLISDIRVTQDSGFDENRTAQTETQITSVKHRTWLTDQFHGGGVIGHRSCWPAEHPEGNSDNRQDRHGALGKQAPLIVRYVSQEEF